jgi:acetyl-CoA decarbonylase/synthase complex subunit gamma
MALTGLQIQKLLPKTNCKECGSNTCLAFAMKLAAKKADLSQCPYASDEAKRVLGAASEPPVKGITLGSNGTVKIGEETVLYRHEKTFVHQTALAININDTDPPESIDSTLHSIRDYLLERVGETLQIDCVAVTGNSGDPRHYSDVVKRAYESTGRPVILRSTDIALVEAGAAAVSGTHGVCVAHDSEQSRMLVATAKKHGHALAVTAGSLDELAALTAEIKKGGFNDLLLDFMAYSEAERFQTVSIARHVALKNSFKSLGYPHIRFVNEGDMLSDTVAAITENNKYGGICVLPSFDPAQCATLMTLRLNIYTDPQKPIQVEPNIYPIGEPDEHSPVFLTTNFSLTYFIVSGEIENSGVNAWLVIPECEGMSVLTAWAAGKFSGTSVGTFIKGTELYGKVQSPRIVIPGFVAQISGELEECLPEWEILVGPQEASDIESFVKERLR